MTGFEEVIAILTKLFAKDLKDINTYNLNLLQRRFVGIVYVIKVIFFILIFIVVFIKRFFTVIISGKPFNREPYSSAPILVPTFSLTLVLDRRWKVWERKVFSLVVD